MRGLLDPEGLLDSKKFGEYGRHHDGVVYDDLQKEGTVTVEQIREWVGHECTSPIWAHRCAPQEREWHAERRELARMVLDMQEVAVLGLDGKIELLGRVEKAEAARDIAQTELRKREWERSPHLVKELRANLHTAELERDEFEKARDALAGAAGNLIKDVLRRYPGEPLRCPYMIALSDALDRHAPGWRKKYV